MDDMAQSLRPKERVCSTGYMELSCRLCTKLSYRNATEMINLFQHRDAGEAVKLRTLSDSVERVGEQNLSVSYTHLTLPTILRV